MKGKMFNSKLVLVPTRKAESPFWKEFIFWLERNLGVRADYEKATISPGRKMEKQLISEGQRVTHPFENKLTFRVRKKNLEYVLERFYRLGCGQLSSVTGDLVAVSIWKNNETVLAWICLDTKEV